MTGRDCRVGAPTLPMPCPLCGCLLQRSLVPDVGVGPHFALVHPAAPVPVVAP